MAEIIHYKDVEAQTMLKGVTMRVIIGPENKAPTFNLRVFEVEPGAQTPHHTHWWEHEVFILSGTAEVQTETVCQTVESGSAVFIPGEEKHCIINNGNKILRLICLVPQEWLKDKYETK